MPCVVIDGVRYVPEPIVAGAPRLHTLFAEGRRKTRMTYKTAGIAAGVNASTIFAIESATYLPKLATAVRLARAYGIGAEQLVASALREVEGCAFCGSLEHDTKDCTWRVGQ